MNAWDSYEARRRKTRNRLIALLAIPIVLFVGGCGFAVFGGYYKDSTVTVRVNDKESVSTDSGHEYRIYTNQGTYVMADSLIKGRFRTGDEYGALRRGHVYTCKAFGWRVPFFSKFKNLYKCEFVK